jgi:hypothetical protein
LASIDAFVDLAGRARSPAHVRRLSLRWLRPVPVPTIRNQATRERLVLGVVVVVVHGLLLFALRAAMRPPAIVQLGTETPFEITIIERPTKPRVMPAPIPPRAIRAEPDRSSRRADSLHAIVVPPPSDRQLVPAPSMHLYASDGALLLPPARASESHRIDLLGHRDTSHMIPGAPRADSPDFHVRAGLAPRDVVNTAGRILGGLIANANAAEAESMGQPLQRADRGVRTSGRDTDPCEDLKIEMINLDDPKQAAQADDRYAQFCEGH